MGRTVRHLPATSARNANAHILPSTAYTLTVACRTRAKAMASLMRTARHLPATNVRNANAHILPSTAYTLTVACRTRAKAMASHYLRRTSRDLKRTVRHLPATSVRNANAHILPSTAYTPTVACRTREEVSTSTPPKLREKSAKVRPPKPRPDWSVFSASWFRRKISQRIGMSPQPRASPNRPAILPPLARLAPHTRRVVMACAAAAAYAGPCTCTEALKTRKIKSKPAGFVV